MEIERFRQTLADPAPPAGLTPALVALWHDGRGHWGAGHDALQDAADTDSAWVHAYLHRKEGDVSNAAYWYRRAGRPVADGPLEAEWEAVARALLARA